MPTAAGEGPEKMQEETNSGETSSTDSNALVLQDLRRFLSRHDRTSSLFDKSAMAVPVAAISALLCVVQRSKAETMMGLQDELKQAADLMRQNFHTSTSGARSYIAVQSGCELFLKYITRTFLELPNFEECRLQILERGERFQTVSLAARDRIAEQAWAFIPDGATVLTHGASRVVAAILERASKQQGRHFDVLMLEGRPDASGAKSAVCYARETNIPVKVVLDSAMAYCMEQVDLVLVGAEGVLENGAVVNKLGTAALAACAQAAGKPFYVAAESYKFARLYPLHQSDLPRQPPGPPVQFVDTTTTAATAAAAAAGSSSSYNGCQTIELDESIQVENPPVDLTHSKFISLLFTDLGVLTPSAVSDELIQLYQ